MSKELIAALERCVQLFDDIGFKSHAEDARSALSRHRSSVESVDLPEPFGYAWHTGRINGSGGYETSFGFSLDEPDALEAAPMYDASTVRSLIAAAVERERELCAEVCEEQWKDNGSARHPFWNDCAAAIRSRGEMK